MGEEEIAGVLKPPANTLATSRRGAFASRSGEGTPAPVKTATNAAEAPTGGPRLRREGSRSTWVGRPRGCVADSCGGASAYTIGPAPPPLMALVSGCRFPHLVVAVLSGGAHFVLGGCHAGGVAPR
jgi:hypothetical protein